MIAIALFLAAIPSLWFEDHQRMESSIGMAVCALVFSLVTVKKYGDIAVGLLFWILISGLRVYAFPNSPYVNEGVGSYTTIMYVTALAGVYSLLVVSLVSFAKPRAIKLGIATISVLCVLDSLLMIYFRISGAKLAPGMLGSHSFDSAFIATSFFPLLGYLRQRTGIKRAIPLGIALVGILVWGGMTGIIALSAGLIGFLIADHVRSRTLSAKTLIGSILFGGSSAGVAILLLSKHGFNSTGRLPVWKLAIRVFQEQVSPVFGAGPGSWWYIGPVLQHNWFGIKTSAGGFFLWLHNDWLTILWGSGLVGLILAVVFYSQVLRKSFSRPWLFGGCISYGVMMLTYSPWEMFLTTAMGLLFIRVAYDPNL